MSFPCRAGIICFFASWDRLLSLTITLLVTMPPLSAVFDILCCIMMSRSSSFFVISSSIQDIHWSTATSLIRSAYHNDLSIQSREAKLRLKVPVFSLVASSRSSLAMDLAVNLVYLSYLVDNFHDFCVSLCRCWYSVGVASGSRVGRLPMRHDVDDSDDILFLMLLRGWIRFSRIVNPLYLISYMFIIQYVYKLDVIPWSSETALNSVPRVGFFILVYPKVYVLPVRLIQSVYITWCIYIPLNTRVTSQTLNIFPILHKIIQSPPH